MNRQIGYIASAHLILFSIAAGYFFLSKISSVPDHSNDTDLNMPVENTITFSSKALKGKTLYQSRCASCHHLTKKILGPPLAGFEIRGPWSDRKQLSEWIRNPESFMKKNEYAHELRKQYPITMTPSPTMTDEEIDEVVTYLREAGTSSANALQ